LIRRKPVIHHANIWSRIIASVPDSMYDSVAVLVGNEQPLRMKIAPSRTKRLVFPRL
jgi:hypothetical protein